MRKYQNQKDRNLLEGWKQQYVMFGVIRDFLLAIMRPFSVTLEVFLRKNMGQRYFNFGHFVKGLILLQLLLLLSQLLMQLLLTFPLMTKQIGKLINSDFMLFRFVQVGYVVLGLYHLYVQWRQENTGNPIHSFESGEAVLEPFAKPFMRLVNILLIIPIKIMSLTLPATDRERLSDILPVFDDKRQFTLEILEFIALNVVVFLLLVVGYLFSDSKTGVTYLSGIPLVFIWLNLAFIPFFVNNLMALDEEWHRILNIRDNIIENQFMKSGLSDDFEKLHVPSGIRETLEYFVEESEDDPELLAHIHQNSPSIADAMAAINPDLVKEDKTE